MPMPDPATVSPSSLMVDPNAMQSGVVASPSPPADVTQQMGPNPAQRQTILARAQQLLKIGAISEDQYNRVATAMGVQSQPVAPPTPAPAANPQNPGYEVAGKMGAQVGNTVGKIGQALGKSLGNSAFNFSVNPEQPPSAAWNQ